MNQAAGKHSNQQISQEIFVSLQKIIRRLDFGKGLRGKAPTLTVTQMRVLSFFNECDVIHISEISPVIGMSIQSVNNVVKRLEESGYVQRSPNKQNKRFSDITLTENGKKLFHAFRAEQVDLLKHILDDLNSKEKRALSAALGQAAGILGKRKKNQASKETICLPS